MQGSRLVDFCTKEAAARLVANASPAPFGAMLDAGGGPHGLEGDAPLEALRAEMEALMANGVVRATAITEVLPQGSERGTIRVQMTWGREGLVVTVPYYRFREGLFWGRHQVRLGEPLVEEPRAAAG
ncbi:hypothetical protein [Sphingomicrobium astaxanthinifaciens]|uniref:hypothetical protein n=1 Tax=Sphingomicrobium astaxanthinifaciens TaxID=1227949 RepID=UPI001FCB3A77|nr:hypothetical protein [Sphingomicrobium astaxanthinifaciens]MCJ7421867.1 hypothetical protein [Sphingomicrobium astaxanthinifaciens]